MVDLHIQEMRGGPRPLSNSEQKLIRSLQKKKYRDEERLFVAEGRKVIEPLLPFFGLRLLISQSPYPGAAPETWREASDTLLAKLSSLSDPSEEIAVFELPKRSAPFAPAEGITVALDAVQNPGNLGTIIRLCDWLGIRALLLGGGTADPFAPKVVQATAGALGNVSLIPAPDLPGLLRAAGFDRIIGASLSGVPLSQVPREPLPGRTAVLFGNEGHGLSPALSALCTDRILIPAAPTAVGESLNVSVSAAIVLSRLTGL